MGVIKQVFIAGLFSLLLLGSLSGIVLGQEENWVEVARFTGTGAFFGSTIPSTDPFTINQFDWRIKWTYIPRLSDTINPYIFRLDVKNASGYIVELLFASNQISGTLNMNQTGEYYLYIDPMHAENYSITIEQNIDSIPEFPSFTILSIFWAITIFAIVFKKKFFYRSIE